jgi:hypothetical protein
VTTRSTIIAPLFLWPWWSWNEVGTFLQGDRTMKKILVFNLILTVIFPAYCFAEPFQSFSTKREIREDILSIIEDGLAKQEEIISYLEEVSADGIITADDECFKYFLNNNWIMSIRF